MKSSNTTITDTPFATCRNFHTWASNRHNSLAKLLFQATHDLFLFRFLKHAITNETWPCFVQGAVEVTTNIDHKNGLF